MERKLENIFPILGVEKDCILSKRGDITIAYTLELPEIFTMSGTDHEAFHQTWIKALKMLPSHSIFHKQDWYMLTNYTHKYSPDISFLARSSERFFNERPYLDHKCLLFITKRASNKSIKTSIYSSLLKKSIVPAQSMHQLSAQEFFDHCGQFESVLEENLSCVNLRFLNSIKVYGLA